MRDESSIDFLFERVNLLQEAMLPYIGYKIEIRFTEEENWIGFESIKYRLTLEDAKEYASEEGKKLKEKNAIIKIFSPRILVINENYGGEELFCFFSKDINR